MKGTRSREGGNGPRAADLAARDGQTKRREAKNEAEDATEGANVAVGLLQAWSDRLERISDAGRATGRRWKLALFCLLFYIFFFSLERRGDGENEI